MFLVHLTGFLLQGWLPLKLKLKKIKLNGVFLLPAAPSFVLSFANNLNLKVRFNTQITPLGRQKKVIN